MYGISVFRSNRLVRLCSVQCYSSKSTKKLLEFLAAMPKANSARIAEAQRQRQNISKKSEKYSHSPSTVYLQVIGSGARGAPNTLYLFTDQKRYLFNCGECTQRLAHEHKVKLSRLDHVFITSKTWRNIGGLPGLSLTLQDVGVPNITLHGPEGLDELYEATKRFVVMKDMNVTMAKCSTSVDFEDNVMSVKYVLLGPHDSLFEYDKPQTKKPKLDSPEKEFEEFIHDETDYYNNPSAHDTGSKNKMLKQKPKPKEVDKADKIITKTEKVLHDLEKRSHCTVAYICTLKKRPGTLDLAKCVELGVKPGPMLGQLKNGLDVVLPDGSLVLSKDVKTPDDPGPVFIVMEVPDLSYLKETEFSPHFDNGINRKEDIPTLVVHITPPHVFNHPTYRAFMAMFGQSTRHLVLNSQNSCLGSEAVHRTQHKLNLLDSEIFPLLRDASVPAVWTSSPSPSNDSPTRRGLDELKNKIAVAQFQNIINMEGSKGDGQISIKEGDKLEVITPRALTMFHLRPKRQVDRSAEPRLHIQEYIQESMDIDGFVSSLEQFRHLIDNIRYMKSDVHKEYPKVVFLGTGSCIPSKTRNTSGIALQIAENRSILIDCGEGTFGQLVRFFGPRKVNSFLKSLKAIYISHLHADHHIGLIGVLQARREAFEQTKTQFEPMYLLAPGQIYTWLSVYDEQFERIKADFTLIPNQTLILADPTQPSSPTELTSAVLASIGVQAINTCLVSHCPNAFGVAIQIDNVHKLTYSGDTIPCEALVEIGQNSTLLIHEATMEDELADEARIKMHSTTSQAIDIGRQMNAQYTVLTHFSQRYARLPRLNSNMLNDNKTVGIAFDNMQISMNDLELLPHMYAPLQLMFAEHCVEMEMKAKHRARHKERRSSPPFPNSGTIHVPHVLHNKLDFPQAETVESSIQESKNPRCVSPGCRNTTSVPIPRARYRESNASRLRLEFKGMTITGFLRNGPRSKSSSPIKSAASSPTRSLVGDSGSPPRRQDSEKPIDLTCTPRAISDTSNLKRDAQDKLKTTSTAPCGYVVDTRAISDTSNLNRDAQDKLKTTSTAPCGYVVDTRTITDTSNLNRDAQDKFKITNTAPCGYVIDTRSKTLSTLHSASAHKEGNIERKSNSPSPTRLNSAKGYGKALVTPVNKKLSIRRDCLTLQDPAHAANVNNGRTPIQSRTKLTIKNRNKSPTENRTKSPTESRTKSPIESRTKSPTESRTKSQHKSSRVIHKAPFNTSPNITDNVKELLRDAKVDIMMSVLVHLIMWWVAHIASYVIVSARPCAVTLIAVGIVFWTATKETTSHPSISGVKREVKSFDTKSKVTSKMSIPKPITPATNRPNRIPSPKNQSKPQDIKSLANRNKVKPNKADETTANLAPAHVIKGTPLKSSLTRIPLKICSENCLKQRNNSTEKLKQQFCRDTPVYAAGRPNSAIHSSTKSFKPQLEDIKSSFLLLNKNQQERANSLKAKTAKKGVPEPKKIDDHERRENLNAIKNKFKSKTFMKDSSRRFTKENEWLTCGMLHQNSYGYEKIEGLNWISWKN